MPAIGAFGIGVGAIGVIPVSVGYEQIGLDTSSLLEVPAGAHLATIVAEGAAVRYRDDGNDPTAEVGMPVAVSP